MIFRVTHVTDIRYASVVRLARFNVRLEPVAWPGQRLFDYRLEVSPSPAAIGNSTGPYVVNTRRLLLADPIASLRIESTFSIEVCPQTVDLTAPGPTVAEIRHAASASRDLTSLGPSSYLFASRIVGVAAEIGQWADGGLRDDIGILQAGQALCHAIHSQFAYDSDATKTDTPPIEAFRKRRGVCQDFAHIMIAALRAHGIPAAYVSGYLRTIPPPGRARLVGCDAMHAWVTIWCGAELGWIGFDPTNDLVVQGDHITVAMGRDYADIAPVDGVFHGSGGQQLRVAVDVLPVEALIATG